MRLIRISNIIFILAQLTTYHSNDQCFFHVNLVRKIDLNHINLFYAKYFPCHMKIKDIVGKIIYSLLYFPLANQLYRTHEIINLRFFIRNL